MRIPPDLMQNTAAAFALFAFLLSFAGIVAAVALYAAAYMALGSIDATMAPQFDSAASSLESASAIASSFSNSSAYASSTMSSVADALQAYSDSTGTLSHSIGDLASMPPLSLDPRLSTAASDLEQASLQFANASKSAALMSASAGSAVSSMQSIADDISRSAASLSEAKRNFKSSLSGIGLASLVFCVCLCVLFASVALSSLSILLSHYPNMLERAEKEAAKKQPPVQKQ